MKSKTDSFEESIFRVTSLSHIIVSRYIQRGDIVVDATFGNGYDTLFLAQTVGEEGYVFGFDIQDLAYENTEKLLKDSAPSANVRLFLKNHSLMKEIIPVEFHGKVSAIMFNLGYLPQSDKSITTNPQDTDLALRNAVEILKPGGIITVSVYIEQINGAVEHKTVQEFVHKLSGKYFETMHVQYPSRLKTPPELFVIRKK